MRVLVLFASFVLATPFLHAQVGLTPQVARIEGRYHGPGMCSVHVTDLRTGITTADMFCQGDGTFEVQNVAMGGMYTVVINTDNGRYEKRVEVSSPMEQLDVYPDKKLQTAPSTPTVSVAELRVPQKARDDVNKAAELIAKSNFSGALTKLNKALGIAPRYARALALKAVVYLSQRNLPAAAQLGQQAAETDPLLPLAQIVKASTMNAVGRGDQAALAANQALRIDPNSWQAHFELAKAMILQHDLNSALKELNAAQPIVPPKFAEIYIVRAWVLAQLNDHAAARADADKYAKLIPNDPRLAKLEDLLKK